MAVRYVRWGDKDVRVSRRWRTVLLAARKAGVRFEITSGHRSILQQTRLFAQNMRLVAGRWIPKPGRPLTARPSVTAPHIRVGNPAHALDIDALDGGAKRLAAWLRKHGARPTFPVPGENWHMDVPRSDLDRLYRKFRPRHRKQQMTANGLEFLIREEGVRRYAYNDPAGHATFGVGHLIHRGPVTNADLAKWGSKQKPASMRKVNSVLRADLKRYEQAVRDAVGREMLPHRFDACVSLAFNIGIGGFQASTVARTLREESSRTRTLRAADAFLLWNQPSMLRARRERERRLFLRGEYR